MSEPVRGTALQKHLEHKARQEKRESSATPETSAVNRSVEGVKTDVQKMTHALTRLGSLIIIGALVWWNAFYSEMLGQHDSLFDVLDCLASSSGACGMITATTSLKGETVYNPTVFWVGITVLVIGLIMRFYLKKGR